MGERIERLRAVLFLLREEVRDTRLTHPEPEFSGAVGEILACAVQIICRDVGSRGAVGVIASMLAAFANEMSPEDFVSSVREAGFMAQAIEVKPTTEGRPS